MTFRFKPGEWKNPHDSQPYATSAHVHVPQLKYTMCPLNSRRHFRDLSRIFAEKLNLLSAGQISQKIFSASSLEHIKRSNVCETNLIEDHRLHLLKDYRLNPIHSRIANNIILAEVNFVK